MFGLRGRGFTIVEILIVFAILSLIAAIAFPRVLRTRQKANENTVLRILKDYASACEAYAKDHDLSYPTREAELAAAPTPYINFALDGEQKSSYLFSVTLNADGYAVLATSLSANAQSRDYRIMTGEILQIRPESGGSWKTP